MSIDALQEKIRKLKNPSMVDLTVLPEQLPAVVTEGRGELDAYAQFCRQIMATLKGTVPAVRFSFDHFALLDGLPVLKDLLNEATQEGFYVVLEAPQNLTVSGAVLASRKLFADYRFDGLILSPYIGTDAVKPYMTGCKELGKDLFFAIRTPNKSALEIQDLLTGSRHVYTAAADLLSRYGETVLDRSGYSRVGFLTSAGSTTSLMELRTKYKRFFMLVDGLDTPSGNAKNASLAFDRLGHGAVVCAAEGITCAWQDAGSDGVDFAAQALEAARRMQKNIWRYVTVI